MADVVREFTIRVNTKGQIEAIKGFEKLDDSIEKTNASMGENDRKQKAVAQATSNSTKAFAKQAQGLGGVVRIYATVAANVFALSSAYNVLKRNADLEILRRSSEQLSVATGNNYNLIADQLRKVTGGAIGFREAMQSANLALSGGLSGTQATQITEIATKAANALGRSVPEAVQRLTQAIVKGEPELADEFGIILRVTEATNEYARSLGKLPTELTTVQKQHAVFNQFLQQGTDKFANVQIQTNPYDKLAASFVDLTNSVVSLVRVPLDPFVKLISESGTAMLGIFAGVAGGIAKLLLPELNKLSLKMVEVAQVSRETAKVDRATAIQKQAAAQSKLNDELFDYFEVLRSSKKLTKEAIGSIEFKGLDKKQSKQLAEELLDPTSFGTEIRSNILKSIFDGDERKMRTTVGRFAKDLEKEIERATAKGATSVSLQGYKGSIAEAKVTVEALGIAWRSTKQLEEEALGSSEARLIRYKTRLESVRSSIKLLGADLKLATTTGYASGLEKGLLKSLFGIRDTFKDISAQVGGGLRGKLAGLFGTGAKLAGGFLGTVTKLAGVFGQWGFIISFVATTFGPLIDALNLTDKNSEKIEESLGDYSKAAKLAESSITELGKESAKTFEDQARNAGIALNIMNSLETNVNNLKEAFVLLGDTQDSFWRFFNDNAESAAQGIYNISKATKQVLDLLPKGAANKIRSENSTFDVQSRFTAPGTFGDVIVPGSGQLVKQDALLEQVKKDLEGTGATAAIQNNRIVIKVPVEISAEQAKKLAEADTFGQAIVDAEDFNTAQTKAFTNTKTAGATALQTIKSFDTAYKDFTKTLADNATQVNGAAKEYAGVTNVINKFNDIVDSNSVEAASEAMASLSPQMVAVIKNYSDLGDASKEATPEQAVEAFKGYRDELARFAVASSEASAEQANLNSQLVAVNDAVTRGDTAQLTQQYKIQSDLIDSQVKALKAKSDEAALNLKILASEGQDSEAIKQKTAERASLEAKILALRSKQQVTYSQSVANEKILVASAKSRLQLANLNLRASQKRAATADSIAKVTGDVTDLANRLSYEEKILKAKIAQLQAAAASKRADAATKGGDKAQVLLKEAQILEEQVRLQTTLGNIRVEQLAKAQREIGINLDNKKAETAIQLSRIQLDLDQKRADIAASNKFSTQELRDASELLSLKKQVSITENDTLSAQQKVTKLTADIKNEQMLISNLRARGENITENTVKLQELMLDRSVAQKEATASIAETEEAILAAKEAQYQLDKKNANPFTNPQEFGALMGEEFRRIGEEFGEKLGSTINRVVDVTLGTVDAGIDAFVDAVRSGEDALQAAGQAIEDTFLDLNTQLIKDQFKLLAREGLGSLFPSLKDIGKSEELVEAETQTTWLQRIWEAITTTQQTTLQSKATENIGTIAQELIKSYSGSDAALKSEQALIASIDQSSDQAKMLAEQTADFFADTSDGFLDSISGLFSNFDFSSIGGMINSAGSGIAGLAQTAISLFLAKGGIAGQLQNRVPMYANGTVTDGPELAMIGEGPKREAVVPLPDNRSIPVTIFGEAEKAQIVENKINVSVNGVQGTEEGLRRSANQIALEIGRAQSRAQGRIG